VRLDQALVEKELARSRTEAKDSIIAGDVSVNGSQCLKPAKDVTSSDVITLTKKKPFVSRAGEKLEGALYDIFFDKESIHEAFVGKRAIDVGSSTGGFTECLLSYGISYVDAVDVGSNQLHVSLRKRDNVSIFENTDIRTFIPSKEYDIVVADVSFISLTVIFSHLYTLGKQGARYILLIKPQFEVGKGNTKNGIVVDSHKIDEVLNTYKEMLVEYMFTGVAVYPSRVQGKEGNQEYFITGLHP
jgi:23S rRNA (cytidine1920-2'-O)/16S rRNA (cytidine1409-2'-O)-methyltransferase